MMFEVWNPVMFGERGIVSSHFPMPESPFVIVSPDVGLLAAPLKLVSTTIDAMVARPDSVFLVVADDASSFSAFSGRTYPNVWHALRVTSQREVDDGVETLLLTPAAKRVLICGRKIDAIDLRRVASDCDNEPEDCCGGPATIDALSGTSMCPGCEGPERWSCPTIDWVICEGGIIPNNPAHVRSLRDQCVDAEVPFYFAGWGSWVPESEIPFEVRDDRPYGEFHIDGRWARACSCSLGAPGGAMVKAPELVVRTIDGVNWLQVPEVVDISRDPAPDRR